jgi:YD repeat-containing protein
LGPASGQKKPLRFAVERNIDLDGRINSYTLGNKEFSIGYDDASRIGFITQTNPPPDPPGSGTNNYFYDNLDHLTSAITPGTTYTYGYDAVGKHDALGNRTSRTAGASTHQYSYSATSNRIASIDTGSGVRNFLYDLNGSTTADGNNTYTYDVRGRMVQATSSLGATNYQINALGQRIRKSNTLGDTVFHYDIGGRLIAESGPGGTLKREYIYLGDIPVGVFQ